MLTKSSQSPYGIIKNSKHISLLFWVCWLTYAVAYLGRLNYVAVMAEVIATGHLSLPQAGLVVTTTFASYGVGQLINGFLGDRVNSKYMMLVGLIVSIMANLAMGTSPPPMTMVVVWGINGFAQAMMWPAIVKLLSTKLSKDHGAKAMINISTSVPVGIFTTYAMSAFVLAAFSWQMVFFLAAVAMATVAMLWFFGMTTIEKGTKDDRHQIAECTVVNEAPPTSYSPPFLQMAFLSGLPLMTLAVVLQGMLRDGVTSWMPVLISDQASLGSEAAVLITSGVPLMGILGVYTANYLNKRILKNEALTAGTLFLVSTIALLVLSLIRTSSTLMMLVALIVAIAVMHGVNTMLISMVPLHFAKVGKSATVTGAMNAFTYLGSGISAFVFGTMAATHGWGMTILSWILIAFSGMGLCFVSVKGWRRFKGDE